MQADGVIIYVAGNPELYPMEYYDPESETYQGAIPDFLAGFAQEYGYDLHYFQPGAEDRRAELAETPTESQKEEIRKSLEALGFELIDDPRTRIVEQVKSLIIEWVHRSDRRPHVNLSQYLASGCRHDYSTLSKLFSETQGTTIEKYFIAQKIERVKELLAYDELSLNEIADLLNYSSTAHLSAQFKSVTGMPPSQFKKQASHKRLSLDKIGQ